MCSAPVLPSGRLGRGAMGNMSVDGEDFDVTPVFEGTSEANPTDSTVADPNPTESTDTEAINLADSFATDATDTNQYLSFSDFKRMGTVDGVK